MEATIQQNLDAKECEMGYAQNKMIYELTWRIKSMEYEMGEFVNKEIQEAPWPEEHDSRINQGMQNAIDNLNK